MKVLILEDNSVCRDALEKIVKSCMNKITVFSFDNRGDAYLCAMDNNIDLFLVDIILNPKERNDSSGIKFADDLRDNRRYKATPIVFITTLSGLESTLLKKVHCFDYIEKPIDVPRVKRRVMEAMEAVLSEQQTRAPEQIMLRYDGVTFPVCVDDVVYVVNRRGVLYIHKRDEILEIPNFPTNKFVNRIRDNHFLTPVRGTAINAKYIRAVDFSNNLVLLKNSEETIPVGGRLKKKFREEFEECFGLTKSQLL